MNPLRMLNRLGQSVWYDNIDRSMLTEGTLENLVSQQGISGITSNPSIFRKAIAESSDYDLSIAQQMLEHPAQSSRHLFFELAKEDIQRTAEILLPTYQSSNLSDGYVSLEVSPDLAYDEEGTIEEARSLWRNLDRPNAMIKVPATVECLGAIETLTADGININVTLLFSVTRYCEVLEAYMKGLEKRVNQGRPVEHVFSVASFFISRVDQAVDGWLNKNMTSSDGGKFQGQVAIANAKLAYAEYQKVKNSDRFKTLEQAGAQLQKLLWASTATKNPEFSDVLYVDELIGLDTVNTMPPATFHNFLHHGTAAETLTKDVVEAQNLIQRLTEAHGLDLDEISETLEEQGIVAFETDFRALLEVLEEKAHDIVRRSEVMVG